jgi:hypothetical protein
MWERGREQKRGRELLEKRRGTSASLYLVKDRAEVGSYAIPDAAGGEGRAVTGPLNRMA